MSEIDVLLNKHRQSKRDLPVRTVLLFQEKLKTKQ